MVKRFCIVGTIKRWEVIEDKNVRPVHVREAVFDAVNTWRNRQKATELNRNGNGHVPVEEILRPLPRRAQAVPPDERKLWIPFWNPPRSGSRSLEACGVC